MGGMLHIFIGLRDHWIDGSKRGYDRKKGACEGMTSKEQHKGWICKENKEWKLKAYQWLLEE
jgi:hypothetical protein